MITKYRLGSPFQTDAVLTEIPLSSDSVPIGQLQTENGFSFILELEPQDVIFGLGEANRGINKRGYLYRSNCSDEPNHTEDKISLYGAHNFLLLSRPSDSSHIGMFFDYPGYITFDIGYTHQNTLKVTCPDSNLDFYLITGISDLEVVKEFRSIIGRSYIPPKYSFGFGQSRWGYRTPEDFEHEVIMHRTHNIPLDMLYMDIDYMEDFKDFTFDSTSFPDFEAFVTEMKAQNIHLIPIIDAGVKIEDGYSVYEEGVKNGYFCKREDESDFVAAVWPGPTHFPDVLNENARTWFGNQYEALLSKGIDGFWNDMNEPAIFYSEEGLQEMKQIFSDYLDNKKELDIFQLRDIMLGLSNNSADYQRFYHNVKGKRIRHDKVHNLFGYNMTRAASEAFDRLVPDKRILMFSRSSYIGMHRYGGVWMGDNKSWWSHILLNLKMLPSLNMCGFLYIGADLGGFGADTTRDLLLRWLALGVFTPLMRNHSCQGTRRQEFYQFEEDEDFRHIISTRYRLIPYLYSEYMKAALNNDMMFKPLSFVYTNNQHCREVEDQLLLGNEIMIAPIYTQNATGRYIYLPEEMMFIKFLPDGSIYKEVLPEGHHYVTILLNEVALFIRKNCAIPLVDAATSVPEIDYSTMVMLGYEDASYERYDDDGITPVK